MGNKKLNGLRPGDRAVVKKLKGSTSLRRRLAEMGLVPGTEIEVSRTAPLGDPRSYSLRGIEVSLRNQDAETIRVEAV